MIEKQVLELHFVRPTDPIPTVELDRDSVPSYGSLVVRALEAVKFSPKDRITIYVYMSTSINFHETTNSAFFGVAGSKSGAVLKKMLAAFSSEKGARARFSDYINASTATRDFHVEDGRVWRPIDAVTWAADDGVLEEEEQDIVHATEGDIIHENNCSAPDSASAEVSPRRPNTSRSRIARSDASVGAIRKAIELTFGLPEGSVQLCGAEGKPLRSDASIATLRKRWD